MVGMSVVKAAVTLLVIVFPSNLPLAVNRCKVDADSEVITINICMNRMAIQLKRTEGKVADLERLDP
jgi:hypothetical protein